MGSLRFAGNEKIIGENYENIRMYVRRWPKSQENLGDWKKKQE